MIPNRTIAIEQVRRQKRPKPAKRWRNLYFSPQAPEIVARARNRGRDAVLLGCNAYLGFGVYPTAEAAEQAYREAHARAPDLYLVRQVTWQRAVADPFTEGRP